MSFRKGKTSAKIVVGSAEGGKLGALFLLDAMQVRCVAPTSPSDAAWRRRQAEDKVTDCPAYTGGEGPCVLGRRRRRPARPGGGGGVACRRMGRREGGAAEEGTEGVEPATDGEILK